MHYGYISDFCQALRDCPKKSDRVGSRLKEDQRLSSRCHHIECGELLGLLRSELLNEMVKSFPLGRSKIQKFHSEHLSSDPPNDRLVDMHTPVIVWGEDPQVEAHIGLDAGWRLGGTACGGQVQECRIRFYQVVAGEEEVAVEWYTRRGS